MTRITEQELLELYDYKSGSGQIKLIFINALQQPQALIRFIAHYTAWNALFGSGVASLAGKIGRCQGVFRSQQCKIDAIADRSVHVASFFFDAARDEFDDRATIHRDTHRCLAQSCLQGMIDYYTQSQQITLSDTQLNDWLAPPLWLTALIERVAIGYGVGSGDHPAALFRSMGYHLGSELLADREFSIIDQGLETRQVELQAFLKQHTVEIAGEHHSAYHWLEIHSGHGGGVEAEHFAWAVKGVNRGFSYVPVAIHESLRHQLHLGFMDFVTDHREFFTSVARY